MKTAVSLSDVISDYVSRYGLTEKARQFFLERTEQDTLPESGDRADERQNGLRSDEEIHCPPRS